MSPLVDLTIDAFVDVPRTLVAESLADKGFWRTPWPGVELETYHDRGSEGARWYVSGALVGTAEAWLEAYLPTPGWNATIVHVFLRADPASPRRRVLRGGRPGRRGIERISRRYDRATRRALFTLKDRLESTYPEPVADPHAPLDELVAPDAPEPLGPPEPLDPPDPPDAAGGTAVSRYATRGPRSAGRR